MPAAVAAVLRAYALDGATLIPVGRPDLDRVEVSPAAVRAVTAALGHRLDARQVHAVTAVLAALALEVAARRAAVVDAVERDAVAWAVTAEAEDLWAARARGVAVAA
ncbi:hypothetical protein [Pseudonocardia alni]|uniref:hypothetical protein n=1 Tax=Pseudonocardia alni TaxID=33907 RepID=UPI00332E42DC